MVLDFSIRAKCNAFSNLHQNTDIKIIQVINFIIKVNQVGNILANIIRKYAINREKQLETIFLLPIKEMTTPKKKLLLFPFKTKQQRHDPEFWKKRNDIKRRRKWYRQPFPPRATFRAFSANDTFFKLSLAITSDTVAMVGDLGSRGGIMTNCFFIGGNYFFFSPDGGGVLNRNEELPSAYGDSGGIVYDVE